MAKKQKKRSFSSRWSKQSATIKAAIITGFFGVFGTLCVLFGTTITPIIESIVERNEPTIGVFVQFDEFNWATGIDASDPTATDGASYSIVTDTCLELVDSNGVMLRTIENSPTLVQNQNLSGTFAVTVSSDAPIIIDFLEIAILDFMPLDANPHSVKWYVGGGGIGWTNEVPVDAIIFRPFVYAYEIPKARRYQLAKDDSVTFMVPVEFLTPGSYEIQENVSAKTFSGETVSGSGSPFTLKWLRIASIDPNDVQLDGMEETYGNLETRLCP